HPGCGCTCGVEAVRSALARDHEPAEIVGAREGTGKRLLIGGPEVEQRAMHDVETCRLQLQGIRVVRPARPEEHDARPFPHWHPLSGWNALRREYHLRLPRAIARPATFPSPWRPPACPMLAPERCANHP